MPEGLSNAGRVFDECHHEVIRRDVVIEAGMHQDVRFPQELCGCSFLIVIESQCDVKPTTRLNERATLERFDRRRSATPYPFSIAPQESAAPGEYLRRGKLCDFVDRQKRVRDQLQSRHRL